MFRKKTERLPGFSSVPGYYIKKKGIEQHADTWNLSQSKRDLISDKKETLVVKDAKETCVSNSDIHRSNLPSRMTRSEICIDNVTHESTLHSRPTPSIPSSPVHYNTANVERVYNRREGYSRGMVTPGATRQFLPADSFSSRASFMDEFPRDEMNFSSAIGSHHHLSRESIIRNQCGGNIIFSRYTQPPPDVVPQHELHPHPSAVLTNDNYGPVVRFHRASTTPGTLCDVSSHSSSKIESPSTAAMISMDHDMLPQNCQFIPYHPHSHQHQHQHQHTPCQHHQHHSHTNYAASASLDRRTTSGPVGRKKVAIEVPCEGMSKSSGSRGYASPQQPPSNSEDLHSSKHSVSMRGDQLSTEELDRILDNLQSGQPLSIKKRTQSLDLLNMQNRLPSSFVEFERYLDAKFQDEPPTNDPSTTVISVSGGNSVPRSKYSHPKGETKGRFFPLSQYNKKRTSPDILPANSSSSSSSNSYNIKVSTINPMKTDNNKITVSTAMDTSEDDCCRNRHVAVQHPTLSQPIKTRDGRPNRLEVPLTARSALKTTNSQSAMEKIPANSPTSDIRRRDRGIVQINSPVGNSDRKMTNVTSVEGASQSSKTTMAMQTSNSNVPIFPEHFVPSYSVPVRFSNKNITGKPDMAPSPGQGRNSPFDNSNSCGFGNEWLLSPISNIMPFPEQSDHEHQQLSTNIDLRSPSGGHSDNVTRLNMRPSDTFLLSVDGMVEAMGTDAKFIQLPELLWPDEDALYEQIRPLLQKDLDLYFISIKTNLKQQQQQYGNNRSKHHRDHSYVNECCGVLSLITGIPMDPMNTKGMQLPFGWLRCASTSTGVIYYHSLLGHCQRHHPNLWIDPNVSPSSSKMDEAQETELIETLLQLKNRASPIEIAEPVKRFFNAAPNNESPLFHIHLKCKSLKDLNIILSQVNLLAYESMQSILIAYETYRAALVRLMYIKKPSPP